MILKSGYPRLPEWAQCDHKDPLKETEGGKRGGPSQRFEDAVLLVLKMKETQGDRVSCGASRGNPVLLTWILAQGTQLQTFVCRTGGLPLS